MHLLGHKDYLYEAIACQLSPINISLGHIQLLVGFWLGFLILLSAAKSSAPADTVNLHLYLLQQFLLLFVFRDDVYHWDMFASKHLKRLVSWRLALLLEWCLFY